MSSIYKCPHCGKKTFNPLTKAFAGQLNSKGKNCPECGKRCVNGKGATIFNAVFSLLCIAAMVIIYLYAPNYKFLSHYEVPIQAGIVLLIVVVPRLVNAFFFKMEQAIRMGV